MPSQWCQLIGLSKVHTDCHQAFDRHQWTAPLFLTFGNASLKSTQTAIRLLTGTNGLLHSSSLLAMTPTFSIFRSSALTLSLSRNGICLGCGGTGQSGETNGRVAATRLCKSLVRLRLTNTGRLQLSYAKKLS